jgi:hypothetical protein
MPDNINNSKFQYNSVQKHITPKETKITRVTVKGKRGYKSVEIRHKGKKTRKSKKALTSKQIGCIKRCEFIPGLFKDCMDCINNQ